MRLELRRLRAGYGGAVVLRDVDLVVPSGKVVALLGPNGAGKSTLLSAVSGLLPAMAGSVHLDREDVTRESNDDRVARGVCHIPEGGAVFPGLTVAENLRVFAPRSAGAEALERATEAFPRLGQRLGQMAGTLSGGEQRMLGLARAYVRDAQLVMVDEISLGLAPILVDEIFRVLARMRAEGVSLLVVEQYVSKVLPISDLVYVLAKGEVAFVGEPHEVAGSRLVEEYLGASAAT